MSSASSSSAASSSSSSSPAPAAAAASAATIQHASPITAAVRDAAWRPSVPAGHSPYTWGKLGQPAEARVGGSGAGKRQQKERQEKKAAKAAASGATVAVAASAASSSSASSSSASASSPPPPPATGGTPIVLGRAYASSEPILPVAGARNILITSALPYVNNVPHLGNIIGCVLSADVYARFCRLRAHNVVYICGTDEYGTATETKAIEEGLTPQQICDKYHAVHAQIYEWFNIKFDKFGRTTTPQQTEISQNIFLELEKNGWSTEASIDQLYCESCARFLADRFVEGTCPDATCAYEDARGDQCDKCGKLVNATELVNPKCKLCKKTPVVRQSKHLFLDLQKLQPELTAWIEKTKVTGEWNENAIGITESWLKLGLKPRCITRDLKWGTPVPKEGYENKVFYVWFDAPIGYISITANYTPNWKAWWQADVQNKKNVELVQFMGKDNIPFHCVMFPSTLMAADKNYTLLHHVSCTEYLNYEGSKFSKSRGTGVFGDGAMESGIPSEVWRYYMLFNRPETSDTVFLWEDFANKNNTELLNNLGNFINRTLSFLYSKCGNVVPAASLLPEDQVFLQELSALKAEYIDHLEHVRIKDGLKTVMNMSKKANQFMQDNKPWELFKTDRARCDTILYLSVNLISTLSVLLEPYMPSLTEKINVQLNQRMLAVGALDASDASSRNFKLTVAPGHILGVPAVLFRKIEDEEIAALRVRFGGAPAEKKKGEPFPLQLILGKVVEAKEHEGAPHLFVLQFETNEPAVVAESEKLLRPGFRQIVAGLRPTYEVKDLLGKTFALLANLRPSNFKSVRSEGMLLTAVKGKTVGLLTVSDADLAAHKALAPGLLCVPRDCVPAFKPNYDVKKELKKLDLMTRGEAGTVFFGNSELLVDVGGGNFVPVIGDKAGEGAKIQ